MLFSWGFLGNFSRFVNGRVNLFHKNQTWQVRVFTKFQGLGHMEYPARYRPGVEASLLINAGLPTTCQACTPWDFPTTKPS